MSVLEYLIYSIDPRAVDFEGALVERYSPFTSPHHSITHFFSIPANFWGNPLADAYSLGILYSCVHL